MLDDRTRAVELKKKLTEVGYEDAIVKSIESFSKRIEELKKEALLSQEESDKHTELSKKIEGLESQRKGLKVQIEVTTKILSEIKTQIVRLCGESSDKTNPIKGSIDSILDNYINLPDNILSLREPLSLGLKKVKEDLEIKIKSFKFDQQIEDIDKEIKATNVLLDPILKKLKSQTEIGKLQEQYKKEIERLEVSKLTKKQFDTAIKDYRDAQSRISGLLRTRQETYQSIQNKINDDHRQIHTDISLNAILKFNKNKFPLYQQVNKTKIGIDHNFHKIFKEKSSLIILNSQTCSLIFRELHRNLLLA